MAHILVTDMRGTPSPSRYPQLFVDAGVSCSGLAFEDDILLQTEALTHRFTYPPGANTGTMHQMAQSLALALEVCEPDFLLTNDEKLIKNLLFLRSNLRSGEGSLSELQQRALKLLDDSLLQDDLSYGRVKTLDIAVLSGFPTPEYFSAGSWSELRRKGNEFGFPFFLKFSFEYAGSGVRTINTAQEFEEIIANYSEGGVPIDDDFPALGQKMVHGAEFGVNFSAWKGELLGYDALRTIQKPWKNGPNCVVQSLYRPAWEAPLRKLVKNMNYSGFGGLDVFEQPSNELPSVIEMNTRPTGSLQICHHIESTIVRKFADCLKGTYHPDTALPGHQNNSISIAIFPDEFLRDRSSPHLSRYPMNVPWNDTTLLRSFMTWFGIIPEQR